MDPKSDEPDAQTEATRRFGQDSAAQQALANTLPLGEIDPYDFDGVFYPGGHGPLWDLAEDKDSQTLIASFYASNKPVAAVCHAPGVFKGVKNPEGQPVVQGKRVTGFSNSEEAAVGLTEVVPFLVEDMLKNKGGDYSKGADWGSYVVEDGHLITGQNPASSEATADALLRRLNQEAKPSE